MDKESERGKSAGNNLLGPPHQPSRLYRQKGKRQEDGNGSANKVNKFPRDYMFPSFLEIN